MSTFEKPRPEGREPTSREKGAEALRRSKLLELARARETPTTPQEVDKYEETLANSILFIRHNLRDVCPITDLTAEDDPAKWRFFKRPRPDGQPSPPPLTLKDVQRPHIYMHSYNTGKDTIDEWTLLTPVEGGALQVNVARRYAPISEHRVDEVHNYWVSS